MRGAPSPKPDPAHAAWKSGCGVPFPGSTQTIAFHDRKTGGSPKAEPGEHTAPVCCKAPGGMSCGGASSERETKERIPSSVIRQQAGPRDPSLSLLKG